MSTRRKSEKAKIEAEVESFDWSLFDALSDKDIEAAAKLDADAVLPNDAELADADLVPPAKTRGRSGMRRNGARNVA